MSPVVKNVLGLIVGTVVGAAVNMAIIMLSVSLVPLPEGADISTTESLAKAIPLFKPENYLGPFLAHAMGTLVGALVAAKIAANNKLIWSLIVGAFFLWGGIKMVIDLPAPMWFNILDLGLAYVPMAFLGYKLAIRNSEESL